MCDEAEFTDPHAQIHLQTDSPRPSINCGPIAPPPSKVMKKYTNPARGILDFCTPPMHPMDPILHDTFDICIATNIAQHQIQCAKQNSQSVLNMKNLYKP